MRRSLFLLLVVFFLTGCGGDTPVSLIKDWIVVVSEWNDCMMKVVDVPTMETYMQVYQPKLKARADKIKTRQQDLEKVMDKKDTEELNDFLKLKYIYLSNLLDERWKYQRTRINDLYNKVLQKRKAEMVENGEDPSVLNEGPEFQHFRKFLAEHKETLVGKEGTGEIKNLEDLPKLMRQMIQKNNDEATVTRIAQEMEQWASKEADEKKRAEDRAELVKYCAQVVRIGYGTEAAKTELKRLAEK